MNLAEAYAILAFNQSNQRNKETVMSTSPSNRFIGPGSKQLNQANSAAVLTKAEGDPPIKLHFKKAKGVNFWFETNRLDIKDDGVDSTGYVKQPEMHAGLPVLDTQTNVPEGRFHPDLSDGALVLNYRALPNDDPDRALIKQELVRRHGPLTDEMVKDFVWREKRKWQKQVGTHVVDTTTEDKIAKHFCNYTHNELMVALHDPHASEAMKTACRIELRGRSGLNHVLKNVVHEPQIDEMSTIKKQMAQLRSYEEVGSIREWCNEFFQKLSWWDTVGDWFHAPAPKRGK